LTKIQFKYSLHLLFIKINGGKIDKSSEKKITGWHELTVMVPAKKFGKLLVKMFKMFDSVQNQTVNCFIEV